MAQTAEMKDAPKNVVGQRRFRLLRDAQCRDNCRPSAKDVLVKAGNVLTAFSETANDRGELFFRVDGYRGFPIELPADIYTTRHPYDAGLFDPMAVESISAEDAQTA